MALAELIEGLSSIDKTTLAAVVFVGLVTYRVYYHYSVYVDVESVGVPPGILGPWKAALRHTKEADALIKEGYKKYSKDGKFFKIASIPRYLVFPTDPKHLQEMNSAPDHVLSFGDAAADRISIDYTMDHSFRTETYHLKVIQVYLTQRLSSILPEIISEVTLAWQENTNIGDEWTEVNIWDVMLKVISRTINRMYVGLPLCRNQEYLDNLVEYATTTSKSGIIIDMAPRVLKPLVSWYILDKPKKLKKLMKFVGPLFEERKKKMKELGDKWTDRPDDAIQWILDSAPLGADIDTESLVNRILFLNFAAIHTTSISITQALYDLAVHTDLHNPLKDEITSVIAEEGGWTKQGLTKMKKLDSVLKESQRMNNVTSIAMMRKAMVPYTFSDGTFVPKGTWLCAPAAAIHKQEEMQYDGFRWERLRKEEGQAAKHQMVSTSVEYLPFGHGRHACPGRFFAANELKILVASIIMNYEFKSPTGERPQNGHFGVSCIPDRGVNMLFRKRKDV
ncbi:cytochrome P450 [Morchella snyderi]|nr:cytochrome P450 [Morchella snyderi]